MLLAICRSCLTQPCSALRAWQAQATVAHIILAPDAWGRCQPESELATLRHIHVIEASYAQHLMRLRASAPAESVSQALLRQANLNHFMNH